MCASTPAASTCTGAPADRGTGSAGACHDRHGRSGRRAGLTCGNSWSRASAQRRPALGAVGTWRGLFFAFPHDRTGSKVEDTTRGADTVSRNNRENRRAKQERRRRKRPTKSRDASKPGEPQERPVSFWAVAFLDLLGYRKVLECLDFEPGPNALNVAELSEAYDRAIRVRRRFMQLMKAAIEGYEGAPLPILPGMAPVPQRLQQAVLQSRKIEILNTPGPDHVVLACSLVPTPEHFPMRAVATVFTGSALAALIQLMMGADEPDDALPLRGGIDIAPGVLLEPERFLYSPALTRAYELESKQAVHPRILIGERINGLIAETLNDADASEEMRISKMMTEQVRRMLLQDEDGAMILDFFGEEIRRSTQIAGDTREIASKAWTFVTTTEQKKRREGNDRVADKYAWLTNYMRPRLSLWGVQA